jgi:hypothetical protein
VQSIPDSIPDLRHQRDLWKIRYHWIILHPILTTTSK